MFPDTIVGLSPFSLVIFGGLLGMVLFALALFAAMLGGAALRSEPWEPLRYEVLRCPNCAQQHIDRGEWATRPHHEHLCQFCGHLWRVEPFTFGVERQPLRAVDGGKR